MWWDGYGWEWWWGRYRKMSIHRNVNPSNQCLLEERKPWSKASQLCTFSRHCWRLSFDIPEDKHASGSPWQLSSSEISADSWLDQRLDTIFGERLLGLGGLNTQLQSVAWCCSLGKCREGKTHRNKNSWTRGYPKLTSICLIQTDHHNKTKQNKPTSTLSIYKGRFLQISGALWWWCVPGVGQC